MSFGPPTTLLVTGGTGTLGSAIVRQALDQYAKVIVLSRDEYKQVVMKREIADPRKRLRFFLGDVRDHRRLCRAMRGVQHVIHCAALKNLEATERDPFETIKTNVDGSMNVVDAAVDCGVECVLAVSTDKAVDPVSCYGASKMAMERLVLAANVYGSTRCAVIRYGNFIGSRGSVIPLWRELADRGEPLPITDLGMVRWWIDTDVAAGLAIRSVRARKQCLLVPRCMERRRVVDVAREIGGQHTEFALIGCRPGERLDEPMMTAEEERRRTEDGDLWMVA